MHRMQSGGWPYSKVGRDSDLRKHRLFVQLFFVHACVKGGLGGHAPTGNVLKISRFEIHF